VILELKREATFAVLFAPRSQRAQQEVVAVAIDHGVRVDEAEGAGATWWS